MSKAYVVFKAYTDEILYVGTDGIAAAKIAFRNKNENSHIIVQEWEDGGFIEQWGNINDRP